MEPRYSYGRHAGPVSEDARRAAVGILVHPGNSGTSEFPLTVRPPHLRDHAGQVCLPGGAVEPGEGLDDCVRRELEEELAPRHGELRIIGRLTPLYVFGTNFYVQPIVLSADKPLAFTPDPREVAAVLPVRIDQFLQAPCRIGKLPRHWLFCQAPGWDFGDHWCWGATAMILAEFRAVCELGGGG